MPAHRNFQELLPLMLYGDLSDREKRELERHLSVCAECRKDLDDFRKTHTYLSRVPLGEIRPQDLTQARIRLFNALEAKRRAPRLWDRLVDLISPPAWPRPAFVAAGLAVFAAGFLVARWTFPGHAPEPDGILSATDDNVAIKNVRFVNGGDPSGEVEFAFDAVKPIRVKGLISSPQIQKVLASALLNERNPGVQLRAANSIIATPVAPLDREVKTALVLTLSTDGNAAVRKQALTALLRYPADREVRDALLQVLLHDKNPSLRIAAINGLDSLWAKGYRLDEESLQTFRNSVQQDDNLYIRVKAQSMYQEVKEQ